MKYFPVFLTLLLFPFSAMGQPSDSKQGNIQVASLIKLADENKEANVVKAIA